MRKMKQSETDRISEMPDEILSSIVSYFTVRDAANASVLSSRWRHLCASMFELEFDLISMFRPHKDPNVMHKSEIGACRQYKEIFVRGVNQFLQYYKGSRLVLFRISFCLEIDSTHDIDQWVSFAVSMGVKNLYLNLTCGNCFSFDRTCQDRNLYTLRSELLSHGNVAKVQDLMLRSCILGPGVINQFSSLKFLELSCVDFGGHEIESILSCCLNLESMILQICTLIPKLCIPGSLHRLKFLAVTRCLGVEEIELSATNLTRFHYDGDSIKIYFSRVPNLKEIFFRADDKKRMQYVFSQLAKDLPLLETLSVYSTTNWVQCLPKQIATFSMVKQLEFFSPKHIKFDLLKIIAILKACPLMEKFHLVMYSVYPKQEITEVMPLECVHKNLKEVHIGGFHFRASYMQLAMYMLEYAVALERMVIDPNLKFYYGTWIWMYSARVTWDKGERANVCSLLQDHSKSSVLIIW